MTENPICVVIDANLWINLLIGDKLGNMLESLPKINTKNLTENKGLGA